MKKTILLSVLGGALLAFLLGGGVLWLMSNSDDKKNKALMKECVEKSDATACQKLADKDLLSVELCDEKNCNQIGLAYDKAKDFHQAAKYFAKGCDLNISKSCGNLGNLYYNGEGVKKDFAEAFKFYQKACSLDYEIGCYNVAYSYENGQGVEQNLAMALEFYEKACDLKEADGCFSVAWIYDKGEKVEQNSSKALNFYQKACDLDNKVGCYNVGVIYNNGKGVSQNFAKALQFYQKSCDLSYANGCHNAGVYYEIGQGVSQDYALAKEHYGKACRLDRKDSCDKEKIMNLTLMCESNNGEACNDLVVRYVKGDGVKKNLSKAFEYAKKACNLNSIDGCEWYMSMIEQSGNKEWIATLIPPVREKICELKKDGAYCAKLGVDYQKSGNDSKALQMWDKACEFNEALACLTMGDLHRVGAKVKQNYTLARKYYEKACEMNNGKACYNLALLYVDNKGVETSFLSTESYEKVKMYATKACDLGVQESCQLVKAGKVGEAIESALIKGFDEGLEKGLEEGAKQLFKLLLE